MVYAFTHHSYAALLRNLCSCTSNLSTNELDQNTQCTIRCRDSQKQYCGGLNAQDYYDVGLNVAGPSKNLQQINRTETSITISFQQPDTKKLKQFIVRANVLHTYSIHPLPPAPNWIFQKEDTQIELVNLYPGTKYNISIISDSLGGEGGLAFVVAETEIGMPDVEPEQPKILSRNNTMMVIEIKPAVNNNGPINFYRIIIQFIDTGLTQNIDENLLTNYQKSQDDGLSYYIAAELEFLVSLSCNFRCFRLNSFFLFFFLESSSTIYGW